MKKFSVLSLILAMMLFFSVVAFADVPKLTVLMDGEELHCDVPPMIINDRTMVPMRAIFEALGAEVSWDDSTKTVTAEKSGTSIRLIIGAALAAVGSKAYDLDSPAVIVDNRTLVPIRFVSEALGAKVDWDSSSYTVTVSTGKAVGPKAYKVAGVTATGDDGNKPENTVDGSYGTRWSYESANCFITFELESVVPVSYIGIAWYCGDQRSETFDVEVSEDGVNYTRVSTDNKTPRQLNMAPYDMGGVNAKFIKLICKGNTENQWNSITEFKAYPVHSSGNMVVEDAGLDFKVTLTDEMREALKKVDKVFSQDVVDWLAGLYDPAAGGFYYCESGRDNKGFSADIESTYQAFCGMLHELGFYADGKYIPEEIKTKLGEYTQQRQAEDDGYFYDPQFGKNVTVSKRERNLGHGKALLNFTGFKALYPYPDERAKAESLAKTADSGSLPEMYKSAEAYRKWISDQPWSTNPYAAGNNVAASSSMAKSLGYGDILIEELNKRQNAETGLWGGSDRTYLQLNASMKCAAAYRTVNYPYPNMDNMIDSVVYIVENDMPGEIAPAWNPLALLKYAKATYGGVLKPEQTERLNAAAPRIVSKIADNVMAFKQKDGGFSYYRDHSSAESQGALVGLGLAEGDINSSYMALLIRSDCYGLVGLKGERLVDKAGVDAFWDKLLNAKTAEKYEPPTGCDINFNDMKVNSDPADGVRAVVPMGKGSVKVVKHPDYIKDRCLLITTVPGESTEAEIEAASGAEAKKITLEYDFMIPKISSEYKDVLFFNRLGDNPCAVNWLLRNIGGALCISIRNSNSGYGDTITTTTFDEWHTLKIDYIPADGSATINFTLDEKPVGSSKAYYNNGDASVEAPAAVSNLRFIAGSGAAAEMYLDNVKLKVEK